jgi:hypothetical protein
MDLATPPPTFETDNGADWFINNGVRWLDREQETLVEEKEWQVPFAINAYEIRATNFRALKEVWFTNSDGDKRVVYKKDWQYILDNYPKLGSTTSGTPGYWALAPTHRPGTQYGEGPKITETPLYIMPPTDTAITVHLYGTFDEVELVENADVNFWSERHPDVLVHAALMSLEGFYRNSQGVADALNMIQLLLHGIDKDVADTGLPRNKDLVMRG